MTAIDALLAQLASPARRALNAAGITTLEELSSRSKDEIMAMHGIGKNALATIEQVLKQNQLKLR